MPLQTQNGKSFEFAVATALCEISGGTLIRDAALLETERNFNLSSIQLRTRQLEAAKAGIRHLTQIHELDFQDPSEVMIKVSGDLAGQDGDVRDLIIYDQIRSIGISCKNNHRAFKHSRLSAKIDFVKKWNLNAGGASNNYWNLVLPIFENLKNMKMDSGGEAKWNQLVNKQQVIYSPILSAFEQEILRLSSEQNLGDVDLAKNFIDYVVGNQDFYKFILTKSKIEIIGFNFHNTLRITRSRYPSNIHSIERDVNHPSTSILRFQEGHTFSFRIHNASTRIEPSLKFDIQALSLPSQHIYTHSILL